jgi:hypothetical protein
LARPALQRPVRTERKKRLTCSVDQIIGLTTTPSQIKA